jgi:hypothetical protein
MLSRNLDHRFGDSFATRRFRCRERAEPLVSFSC